MSSPIGHSLAGYLVQVMARGKHQEQLSGSTLLKSLKPMHFGGLMVFVIIANAPDLDFLPGLLINEPNRFHHGISHSIGAAIMLTGMIVLFQKSAVFKRLNLSGGSVMMLYGSHLLLDVLCLDARPPQGIPLFWPLSDTYWYFPILPPVKHALQDDATIIQFLADAFSVHNLGVMLMECLMAGILLCAFLIFKRVIIAGMAVKKL